MAKTIKLKNNTYWDSNSIAHNYAMVFYQNTSQNGMKWSYQKFKASSGWASGSKISYSNGDIIINNAKAVKINVKMTIASNSYNYDNSVVIWNNGDSYIFKFDNAKDYIISDFIIKKDTPSSWNINLRKYTNNLSDQLVTTDTLNYMSVEIIE